MTGHERILDIYGSLSTKTGEMLNAARSSDWDRLIELEQDCGTLVDSLRRDDTAPSPGPEYMQRKATLIRKLLADDAEIRRYTEPWMAQLEVYLGSARQENRLQRAYGTSQAETA